MEDETLKSILYQLKEINKNLVEQQLVKTLDYKEVADIMHVNTNKSGAILKRYGFRCGHWAIEQSKLKEILRNGNGDLLK